MSPDVTVEPATIDQREVVGRLLELNAYEFSRFDGRSLRADATFGCRYLDDSWTEPGRTAYLVRVDGELAGLALVRRTSTWSMAEFLVVPKHRRAGVGTAAARAVFASHPGEWEVHEIPGNDDAAAFWRLAIPLPFAETVGEDGTTQRFRIG